MLNTANLKFKRYSYMKVLSKYTTQNTIHNLQILTTLSSSWQFTTCPTIGLGGGSPLLFLSGRQAPRETMWTARERMAGKRCRANCFSPPTVGFGRRRLHRLTLARHPQKWHPVDARSFNLWWMLHLGSILPPPLPHDRIRWICLLHGLEEQIYVLPRDSLWEYRRLFALLQIFSHGCRH